MLCRGELLSGRLQVRSLLHFRDDHEWISGGFVPGFKRMKNASCRGCMRENIEYKRVLEYERKVGAIKRICREPKQ